MSKKQEASGSSRGKEARTRQIRARRCPSSLANIKYIEFNSHRIGGGNAARALPRPRKAKKPERERERERERARMREKHRAVIAYKRANRGKPRAATGEEGGGTEYGRKMRRKQRLSPGVA